MTPQESHCGKLLEDSVSTFESGPEGMNTIRRLSQDVPEAFALQGLRLLLDASDTKAYRFVAMRLAPLASTLEILTDQWLFTDQESIGLARRILPFDITLDVRLAKRLPQKNGEADARPLEGARALRALTILNEISPGSRMVPILGHLIGHEDRQISSRAASLIGSRVKNNSWAKRVTMQSDDPRIRANALESLWGSADATALDLFRSSLEDTNNRVVGNAIVGLHLASRPEAEVILTKLIADERPGFRMTAAWAMGRLGDSALIPFLTPLIRDSDAGVRSATLRSLRTINQSKKLTEAMSSVEPITKVSTVTRPDIAEPELVASGKPAIPTTMARSGSILNL